MLSISYLLVKYPSDIRVSCSRVHLRVSSRVIAWVERSSAFSEIMVADVNDDMFGLHRKCDDYTFRVLFTSNYTLYSILRVRSHFSLLSASLLIEMLWVLWIFCVWNIHSVFSACLSVPGNKQACSYVFAWPKRGIPYKSIWDNSIHSAFNIARWFVVLDEWNPLFTNYIVSLI